MLKLKNIIIYIAILVLITQAPLASFAELKLLEEEQIDLETKSSSQSNDSAFLSLKQALDIALKNNHHVRSALATLPVEKANLIIAKYRPNPYIGSDVEAATGGSLHPADLGIELELGRKRHWRIQVAKEKISKKELEIRKVLWEVHAEVHIAYASLSVMQELLDFAKKRTQFYNSLAEVAQKRLKAGDISELEYAQAKMQLLKSENAESIFEGELRKAKVEFNHLLGRDPKESISLDNAETLKPNIDLHDHPKLKEIIDNALEKRLEIAILEKDYGIKKAEIKKAKWERLPNLAIEAGATKPSLGSGSWGPYFAAMAEIPVFNRKQGEIKKAESEVKFLEKEEDRIKHDIQIEVANSYEFLEVAEEQIHRFKEKLLGESKNILEMIQRGYKKGKLSFSEVLIAEQQDREVRQSYLESLLKYRVTLASLEHAVGEPLYDFGEKL